MARQRYIPLHARGSRRDIIRANVSSLLVIPKREIVSSLQILVGRAFPLLGILLAGILVARALGPSRYGTYTAAVALGVLTVAGVTAGLPLLILRRSAEGDLDRATLFRAARLQISFSLTAVAVAALLGAIILGGIRGALAGTAGGIGWTTNGFASLGQSAHAGRRRYRRTAAVDITVGVLYPVLTLIMLRIGFGIIGALFAIAIAGLISCFVAWTGLPEFDPTLSPSRLRITSGLLFSVLGIVSSAYARTDSAILIVVAGSTSTGYYSAAYRILGPFSLLGSAFGILYLSRLSEASTDPQRWSHIRRVGTTLLATISLLGVAVLLIVAPPLIHVLYGHRFYNSIGPARILLLSVIPWAFYIPMSVELNSLHLERRVTVALGIGLVLDLGLIAGLGHEFGASGAAWAWVGSECVMLVGLRLLSNQRLLMDRKDRLRRSDRAGDDALVRPQHHPE